MRVTNKSKASLGFPCDTIVHPGESADVSDDHLNHPVVAGWVDEGKIVIGDGDAEVKADAPKPKRGAAR